MALSTSRVCVPQNERRLCPRKKSLCPGECKPGFCLNTECLHYTRPEMFYSNPEVEKEADLYRQRIESAVKQQKYMERKTFLADERKQMGMIKPDEEGKKFPSWYKTEEKNSGRISDATSPLLDLSHLKVTEGRKTMRAPARPSCMLEAADLRLPYDDLSQLSLFLRTSTMPGYGPTDTISEYHDTHNMAVWNNRKDMDRQLHKFKRDWLSEDRPMTVSLTDSYSLHNYYIRAQKLGDCFIAYVINAGLRSHFTVPDEGSRYFCRNVALLLPHFTVPDEGSRYFCRNVTLLLPS